MRLVKVGVHGYKRFSYPCEVNVDSKVVAVVGPNEIGKTSFLKAIEHLSHDETKGVES